MGRPRILVIDDEPEIRNTLADILGMDGHDVQTASDGREGLERIGRHPFDLILCDLRMPERTAAGSTTSCGGIIPKPSNASSS